MALKGRAKRRHIAVALSVVPADGARAVDYPVSGGVWPPPLHGLSLVGGWVGVTLFGFVAFHSAFLVGLFPAAVAFFALNQPRGRRSFFSGRPEAVVGLASAAPLQRVAQHRVGYSKIYTANSVVWIKDSVLPRLRESIAQQLTTGWLA